MGNSPMGSPLRGIISQEGVFPNQISLFSPPIHLKQLWKSPTKRFKERAKSSSFKNAQPLRGEALTQTDKGWIEGPYEISPNATLLDFDQMKFNFAFRFGVEQMNKLRACGDLRQNMVNLRPSFITPITLPTWDHIAQLSKGAYSTNDKWSFLKADRDSSYKQLPLGPDFAGITVVTPRGPAASKWHAFFPRVLLFGAVSEVIRYN